MAKSIIPIVTKVKPTDDSFDFDEFRQEMENIMNENLTNTKNTLLNTENITITEEEIA